MSHINKSLFFYSSILILVVSVNFQYGFSQTVPVYRDPFENYGEKWVDSVFKSLSLEERIGQLIMVHAYSDERHVNDMSVVKAVKESRVGGIIFMKGGPVMQAKLTNKYQELAKTPLMIAIDAEWGLDMRLDSTVAYPRQLTLGAIQDNRIIYDMAADLARQMKRIGAHINFAPVVDVNVNPRNPVIGNRSFGEDKLSVSEKGVHYMNGLQDNRIMAVGKHFPGHGDTDQDSHYTLPVILHDRARFDSLELVPFRELIDQGVAGIMTAHLHIPEFDDRQGFASTLSPVVIDGLLRQEMGFKGLIFTDALNMQGVSDYFEPGELEVLALIAGNDILLFPADAGVAVSAVKKAVENGLIDEEIINERCKRVLKAKYWMGLNRSQVVDLNNLIEDLNNPGSEVVLRQLISSSITLLKNNDDIIPIKRADTIRIAVVSAGNGSITPFQEGMERYTNVSRYSIDKNSTLQQFNELIGNLKPYNLVIVGIHNPDNRRSRQYGITPQLSYFIRNLAPQNNVVMTLFASPYGLEFFDDLSNLKSIIVSYDDSNLAQDYSAQLIFGAIPSKGRLPVNTGTIYRLGEGIITNGTGRMGYSVPGVAGMDPEILSKIDSLIADAIKKQFIPGAQIFVSRRGMTVYNRSFGYHTYQKREPVTQTDLYDIASVTKIAASVPALMLLMDQGKIDLNNTLGHYLPYLEGTNKQNLKLIDVLTHQAGLHPWIPFYYDTFESMIPEQELFSRQVSANFPFMLGNYVFMNRNFTFKKDVFSDEHSDNFSVKVANRMYMNNSYLDTIIQSINESQVRSGNSYLYSDLGYYYIKDIIEKLTEEPLNQFVESNIYSRLGAGRMTYLPLNKFDKSEIVPTENDMVFRRQLVHGYVHDPGTAMIGGVGGHAGLFSNAEDLAKVMQLFIQNGTYGGQELISSSTISKFTSAPNSQNGNRRGIGFDKPESTPTRNGPTALSASPESFGHSGFTGTFAWADPKEELVYVFLSNRVHPDQFNNGLQQSNLRTQIQQIIYNSIIKLD